MNLKMESELGKVAGVTLLTAGLCCLMWSTGFGGKERGTVKTAIQSIP